MMLKNIPNKFTQRMLLDELDGRGFKAKYNFFYLPIDFRNRCNVGYAFLNFVSADIGEEFLLTFSGLRLSAHSSKKTCVVCPARIQGFEANVAACRNSPVMGIPVQAYKPLVFYDGVIQAFPDPEVPIPPVSLRSPTQSS